MKKLRPLAIILILAMISQIPGTIAAGPTANPPNSNTPDATFNSVKVGPTQQISLGADGTISAKSTKTTISATTNAKSGYSGISGTSTSSANGVYGFSPVGYGIFGVSTSNAGVFGWSSSGTGVKGKSAYIGVFGQSSSGTGVVGLSSHIGVTGTTVNGIGVSGNINSSITPPATATAAGLFEDLGTFKKVILVNKDYAIDATGNVRIKGTISANTDTAGKYGISGTNTSANGNNAGVYGFSNFIGVKGQSTGADGVYGKSTSSSGNGVAGINLNGGNGVLGSTISGIGVTGIMDSSGTKLGAAGLFEDSSQKYGSVTLVNKDYAIDATGNVNINGNVNIKGKGGYNTDLTVNGRIKSGDAKNVGGIWVNNAFMGTVVHGVIGFYNGGRWRFTQDTENTTTIVGAKPWTNILQLGSTGSFGTNKIEFWSNWGSTSKTAPPWRPASIKSIDEGNWTGGLAFYDNGRGFANKQTEQEVMRMYNNKVIIGSSNTISPGFNTLTVDGLTRLNALNVGLPKVGPKGGRDYFNTPALSINTAGQISNPSTNNGGAVTVKDDLTVHGKITSYGGWSSSDRRLKKNIKQIHNALDKVDKLTGVYFNWKNASQPNRQVGFIAQDVQKVLPEVVSKGANGYYSVEYGNITALITEAVKELDNKVNTWGNKIIVLEKANASLKAQVDSLNSKINNLENRMNHLEKIIK